MMADDPHHSDDDTPGDDRDAQEPPQPYESTSSEALDDAAREMVNGKQIRIWLSTAGEITSARIDGPCPRCKDHFSQTEVLNLPASTVRGPHTPAPDSATAQAASSVLWADFLCDCDVVHPNTPPGERGCGAGYSIEVTTRHDR